MGSRRLRRHKRRLARSSRLKRMREYQGADANRTLTPLERTFFKALENRGILCQSIHFWGKGVQIMAVTPLLPSPEPGPKEVGCWLSLS